MAITDIKAFAHLTASDIETLGQELDTIRRDVELSLGERDAKYIRRTITAQRVLEAAARATLFASKKRWAWVAGTAMLSVAKIIENMELGHNISHGQWDWMNDPEIHSTTWEWDMTATSAQWKHAHNYSHHTYTNVLDMDHDVNFGILRMTRDEEWRPINLAQPVANLILAALFEWGIALHDLSITKEQAGISEKGSAWSEPNKEFYRKAGRQIAKDYVIFPALTGPAWKQTLKANATANLVRNFWAYAVIFCGHFPDGAEKFTQEQFENETQAEWYLRQMLGSANIDAGPVMGFMTGNLSYQIEHHLFPDLPSNRYPQVAVKVRDLCEKYDLPYTSGPLGKQYLLAFRTIHKLALPDRFLKRTADDAPETSSERKFAGITLPSLPSMPSMPSMPNNEWLAEHLPSDEWLAAHHWPVVDPVTGKRKGLRSAMAEAKVALKEKARHEKAVLREAKASLQEKARVEKELLREKARNSEQGRSLTKFLRRNRKVG